MNFSFALEAFRVVKSYFYQNVIATICIVLLMSTSTYSATVSTNGDYGNVSVIEFAGSPGEFNALLGDGSSNDVPRQDVVKEFLNTHPEEFDFVVFFTNFDYASLSANSRAFYTGVKNDIDGIGSPLFDNSDNYSPAASPLNRLQGLVDMGNLSNIATNPTDPAFEESLLILSHEMMHRWGARLTFLDPENSLSSNALLAQDNAHWNFYLHTGGSVLYGNNWQDNNDGTFTSLATEMASEQFDNGRLYSDLDLYAMGLLDSADVPDQKLIQNPVILDDPRPYTSPKFLPYPGITVSGVQKTISINDILADMGPRCIKADVNDPESTCTPTSAATSQKSFRMAFIYLVSPGSFDPIANKAELQKLEKIREQFQIRYSILTNGQGLVQVANNADVPLPTNPGVTDPTGTIHPSASVDAGVSWLQSRQLPDGSWQDRTSTTLRDTAVSSAALSNFSGAATDVNEGNAWLGTASAENTDYLSRKVLQLKDSASKTALLSQQNTDGGWGSTTGYLSNPVDTSLALKALFEASHPSDQSVTDAVIFLISAQNGDGGWGVAGGGSYVQPTANALYALASYNNAGIADAALANGLTWLKSKQNPDGGFGNSPSTVYDTAVAVDALMLLAADRIEVTNASNYLLSKQFDDGSWNNSAYQTALAVDALYAVQIAPDLAVSSTDIQFNPDPVTLIPSDVTITVSVNNLGSENVGAVDVSLYEGDPALNNIVGTQSISVNGNSNAQALFSTAVNAEGDYTFYAVVDEANLVAESNELNNIVNATVSAAVPPPTVGFTLAVDSSLEDAGTVQIQVELSHASLQPASVDYSVNVASTAGDGSDYILASGTLDFAAQETSKLIPLQILEDAIVESNETVIIDLSNPVDVVLGQSPHIHTIIDNEPPVVTISSPTTGYTTDTTPILTYSVSSGNVTVKVDGIVVGKVSGQELDALSEGVHTVIVETVSAGGAGSDSVTFTVDSLAPQLTITSPVESTIYPGAPTLNYSIVEANNIDLVNVVIDQGLPTEYVSPARNGDSLAPLANGTYTVTVEATDESGKFSSQTVGFSVEDSSSPLITIVSPAHGQTYPSNPLLDFAFDNPTNIATVNVYVNNVLTPINSGESLTNLKSGVVNTVRIVAQDTSGNTGTQTNSFVFGELPYVSSPATIVSSPDYVSQLLFSDRGFDAAITPSGDVFAFGLTMGDFSGAEPDSVEDLLLVKHAFDGTTSVQQFADRSEPLWGQAIDVTPVGDLVLAYGPLPNAGFDLPATAGPFLSSVVIATQDVQQPLGTFDNSATLKTIDGKRKLNVADVKVDSQGYVYVLGVTTGRLDRKTQSELPTSELDYFLAKYDSQMNYMWSVLSGIPGEDYGVSLWIDYMDFVYVAGYRDASPGSGGTEQPPFIQKYNAMGGTMWASNYLEDPIEGVPNVKYAYDIVVDNQGAVYVTGEDSNLGIYVVKYNQISLNTMNKEWHQIIQKYDDFQYTWDNFRKNERVIVDSNGNVFVAGFANQDFDGHKVVYAPLPYRDVDSAFLYKFDNNGNYIWSRLSGTEDAHPSTLLIDNNDNLYLLGTSMTTSATAASWAGDLFSQKFEVTGASKIVIDQISAPFNYNEVTVNITTPIEIVGVEGAHNLNTIQCQDLNYPDPNYSKFQCHFTNLAEGENHFLFTGYEEISFPVYHYEKATSYAFGTAVINSAP